MATPQRFCLECGEPLVGRADKKFCSDYCRNAYNNRKNRETNALIRKVNAILKRNRKILEELNPTGGPVKVSKKQLAEKGFDFSHITGYYRNKKGDFYRYVYDHGYLESDKGYIVLVRKFEDEK